MHENTAVPALTRTGPTNLPGTDADLTLALQAFHRDAKHGVLSTPRYQIGYFRWGSGPPIVFIHGMADRAQAFVMVMHRLIQHYTCIAYELPDGKTDGSDLRRYKHADYVADLVELLDHLKLPTAAVLGSSFGSTIALAALATVPGRLTHGMLQGGFAHRPLSIAQRSLCRIAQYWPGWFADWPALYRRVLWQIVNPTLSSTPKAISDFLVQNGGRTPIQAAAIRSLTIDKTDLRPLLPSIRTPLLLIGGDRDPLVPRRCEQLIAELVPSSRRVEFAGCGHYPQYSHPIPMAEEMRKLLSLVSPTHKRGQST